MTEKTVPPAAQQQATKPAAQKAAAPARKAPATPAALPAALGGLPLTLTVRIGTAKMTVRELTSLTDGAMLTLDARVDEPLEICVEDRVLARGELTEAEGGGLGVRIIEMAAEAS